jgi:hypothetical protein
MRVKMADVPWHLATGRLIVEDGVLPTTNTFSWTFPDHPLYQQYPLFQAGLYLIWKVAGFEGLSILTSILWTSVLAVWIRWGGTWRQAAIFAPAWFLALLGVQRHLLLRPEVLSLLFLGLLLLVLDRLRVDDRWRWVGAAVFVQWMWAVSHQLFAIGLAVQVAFLIHLALSRAGWGGRGFANSDSTVPIGKPIALLGASVLASTMTPLGVRSVLIPFQSIATLLTQGASTGSAQSAELAPVWTDPIASLVVVAAIIVVAVAAVRSWGKWMWFEFAFLVLGVGLGLAALRGIGFFSVLVIGVATRWFSRSPDRVAGGRRLEVVSVVVIVISLVLVTSRFSATPSFLAVQPGIGRAVGEWPDATIAYLEAHPQDGPMFNIGWGAANVLIWEEFEVFVDPRWETYPKEFLLDSIDAMEDPALLAQQIDRWKPALIVAELRLPEVQERMAELVAGGEWGVVHADVLHLVLERGVEVDSDLEFVGWNSDYPHLFAQEKIRVACWYENVGRLDLAEQLRTEAEASGLALGADLERFGSCGKSEASST